MERERGKREREVRVRERERGRERERERTRTRVGESVYFKVCVRREGHFAMLFWAVVLFGECFGMGG